MSSIDERIVRMRFDNQGFESGVSTTMSTLEKLKNALKFKGASDGVKDVSSNLQKLGSSDIGGLSGSVETVTAKFSALGVIGVTALANITNSAVNAGKSLVKSLTLDPIMTGFSEYETKMGSIQTILANTAHHGTTLEDVNKALGDLNTYSDKTIYNFQEMARNIGTFTAAGIDLDTSTAAIKGIANLAAISGSNSQQASTAMYQLSQALAAGRVSLADWNSVVNAGMGGKVFQDALIRTSEQLGTGAEAMIEKYGSFRDSLTQGEWLTTEVLTETLKQLSGAYTEADLIAQGYSESQAKQIMELAKTGESAATEVKTFTQLMDTMKESVQSGWAQTWEHIIGGKEQSTKLLTSISDAFNNLIQPSTDARNAMLKFWNENGGRDAVIKGLTNVFQGLGKGLGAVRDAFKEVFPPMTGEKLVEISKGFKKLTENFKMSDKTAEKIKNVFKGLFSVIKTGASVVGNIIKALSPLGGVLGSVGGIILTVASSIGKFISSISEAISKSNVFGKIGDVIKSAFKGLDTIFDSVAKAIDGFFSNLGNLDFGSFFSGIGSAFGGITKTLGGIFDGIGKALGSINFGTILDGLGLLLAGGIFKKITGFFDGLSGALESFTGIGDSAKGILDGVKGALESYQSDLDATKLLKLAGAVALLSGSLILLASINPGNMESAIAGLMTVMVALGAMMKFLSVLDIGGMLKSLQIGVLLTSMIGLATAILLLAGAVKSLSSLKWDELAKGLVGVITLLGSLVAVSKLMNTQSSGMIKTATGLIIFAAAIRVLVGAVESLGKLDANTLIQGLVGVAALMTEIGVMLKLVDFGGLGIKNATGLLIFSAAITVLGNAVKSLGSIDANSLIQGLVGVAAILAEIGVFTKLIGQPTGLLTTAAALVVMGAAMNILAGAVRSFASMNWEELAVGLTGMAGALVILAASTFMLSGAHMVTTAVGIAALSASLLLLSTALQSFTDMSWQELAIGLAAMAGSLVLLAAAMMAMSGGLAGAAAMLVMAGALALLVPQVVALSQLSLAEVGIALLTLAGAFTVLGLAALVLTPVIPSLMLLGVAIGLMGVGCMAAGAGLALVGTGLATIAAVGGAAIQVLVNGFTQLMELLPTLGTNLGLFIQNLATGLASAIPAVVSAIGQLIVGLLQAISSAIPQITTTAVELITAFCTALGTAIPQIISVGIDLILALLEGIASNMGELVTRGVDCIVNFIDGIASNLGRVIEAGINLINSLADGIRSNGAAATSAVINLISAVVSTLLGAVGQFLSAGIQWISNLISGIRQKAGEAISAAGKIVADAISAAKQKASDMVNAGIQMVTGFISGIKQKASAAVEAAKGVVSDAINAAKSLLGIKSPSRVFMGIGRYTIQGFALGLEKNSNIVSDSAENVAKKVVDVTSGILSKVSDSISNDIDATPTISPVMDLSNIEQGSRRIGDLLNENDYAISAKTSGIISSSIGTIQNGNDNSDILHALKDLKGALSNVNSTTYRIDGITYDDGTNVSNAIQTLVRAARIERRI